MEIASVPAVVACVILTLGLIIVGCPIFISLGVSSVVGVLIARGTGGLMQVPLAMYAQINSFVLVAIPLFILMGEILSYTGIASDIYEFFSRWTYRIGGGLAIASIYTSALFGALCGVSIAGVAAIGPLAIPEMLRRNYDHKLAAGAVTASGALSVLIPPSIVLIVYGSIAFASVGALFMGGIIPGLFLATAMAVYVVIRVRLNRSLAPPTYETLTWKQMFAPLARLWPALMIVLLVLGSIYGGVATPTEAASMGVVGSLLIGLFVYKSRGWKTYLNMLTAATHATVSVLAIAACALAFGNFLSVMRIPEVMTMMAMALPIPPIGVIFIFMLFLVVGGMFIDAISLILVTTPILLPTILAMGFDPIWYGIILTLNIEMAVITPPVGLNLYTMKAVAPYLDIGDIIKGSLPYVAIEFAVLSVVILVPQIALWLPSMMRG